MPRVALRHLIPASRTLSIRSFSALAPRGFPRYADKNKDIFNTALDSDKDPRRDKGKDFKEKKDVRKTFERLEAKMEMDMISATEGKMYVFSFLFFALRRWAMHQQADLLYSLRELLDELDKHQKRIDETREFLYVFPRTAIPDFLLTLLAVRVFKPDRLSRNHLVDRVELAYSCQL